MAADPVQAKRPQEYFPPIHVEGWQYTTEARELSREDSEDFLTYICRVVWAILTCDICSQGLPSRRLHRQVIHEVVETMNCVELSQNTPENRKKILAHLFAP